MISSLVLPLLLQSAEPPVPGWNCANPMVQQEMNWCAGQDLEAAERIAADARAIADAEAAEMEAQGSASDEESSSTATAADSAAD